MLVPVPQLDSRQEYRSLGCCSRIPPRTIECAVKRPVIGDVDRIESRASMPLPVPLRAESRSPIVRRFSVTVKIHSYQIAIVQLQRRHRPGSDKHDARYRNCAAQESGGEACRSRDAEPAGPSQLSDVRRSNEEEDRASRKRRPVLQRREKCDGVEDVGNRGEQIVQQWRPEGRGERGSASSDIHQRRRRKNRRDHEYSRNHERPSVSRRVS